VQNVPKKAADRNEICILRYVNIFFCNMGHLWLHRWSSMWRFQFEQYEN